MSALPCRQAGKGRFCFRPAFYAGLAERGHTMPSSSHSDTDTHSPGTGSLLNKLAQPSGGWSRLAVKLCEVEKKCCFSTEDALGECRKLSSHVLYLIFPEPGRVRFRINEGYAVLFVPSAVVCEPGDAVDFHAEGSGESVVWELRCEISWEHSATDGDVLRESREAVRPYEVFALPDLRMEPLCRALEEGWRGDELERFRCQALFQEMVYVLLRQVRAASARDPRSAVAATKSYMDRYYRDPLTVERLANMSGVSQGYFMQLFKDMYGSSPIDYISERRIEEARHTLRRLPDMPLHEVAKTVGYDDEGYFSRRFRQKVGLSPNAYRKSRGFKAIALNYHTIGYLLALQIIPSGARLDPRYVREYHDRYYADIALHLHSMPDDDAVNRALARHEPDMIMVRDNTDAAYVAWLQKLTDVLVLPWNPSVHWRALFQLTATFLRKETQAERWLLQYEREAERVRRQIPLSVQRDTLLILSATESGLFLVGGRHAGAVLYGDIGLEPAFATQEALQTLEPERLEAIGADRILILADSGAEAQRHLAELVRSSGWGGLDAVRNRKIHRSNRGLWFEYTPHAHLWSLDAAARLFGR